MRINIHYKVAILTIAGAVILAGIYWCFGGWPRFFMPLPEIEGLSDRLRMFFWAASFFVFFMTLMIGTIVFIFISKPIRAISSIAKEVPGGHYSGKAVVYANDEIGDLAKAINGMSEQIHARSKEVVSSQSRFEAVVLSMCEGTMVVDQKGTILLMNEALRTFFHIERNPIGRKPLEVIRHVGIQEIVDKVLRSRVRLVTREISFLSPEEKTMQVYASPVRHGKEMDGAVLVFHDITEVRRLEGVRRDFVANASHEIRTPLTNIKGYTEALLGGAMNNKKDAMEFLQIIHDDSNRLVQLADDLLDLAKIESNKIDLTLSSHSVESIIDQVMTGLKPQANNRGITIKKDIPVSIPNVKVNDRSIAQVFLNIIDNGIKYNKDGGSVTISVTELDRFIQINIADTGIGIPADDIPRVFERFYRVDKARSRELGGTGLGLSIVKHIVQAHNGDVGVESNPDQGSIFSFTLPKV